ncbi:hypothetical protein V9L05_22850 (plasmid) [Bernardetia sp. Wsw4-3y2]|uniref:hypothetical protein n=1 Tax=Bernardetia sp. Wsw4-3y2 TaxID=3127471 RepID=UPI0030CC4753
MKKHIILFFLFVTSLVYNPTYGMVGLADETYYTPYGNEIDNWTGNTLKVNGKEQLTGLKEWHFYKGFIIGKCSCYPPFNNREKAERQQLGSYFVFNEKNNQSHFFETELEWDIFLEQNNLKPILWTRWHDGGDMGNILFFIAFLLIFYFFVSIPLLICFFIGFYKNVKKEGFKFSSPYFIGITCLLSLIFLTWILEQFPNSI